MIISFSKIKLLINNSYVILTELIDNKWSSSLERKIYKDFKKMNKCIVNINKYLPKLKKQIHDIKELEMFNFDLYNSWLKKQILSPLKQIEYILTRNLKLLEDNLKNINKQIEISNNQNHITILNKTKYRNNLVINELIKNKNNIEKYISMLNV